MRPPTHLACKSFLAAGVLAALLGGRAEAQQLQALPVPPQDWSFRGATGRFDYASVQRGFAVYSQVCASCHSLRQMTYGDLSSLGLDADQLHDIAASQPVPAGTDAAGNVVLRAATPGDHFRLPYANEAAARAANAGALPPDQSRLAGTIQGGPSFIQAYLTGFRDTPSSVTLGPGMHYNIYVPGNAIAMPDVLHDAHVRYTDGTRATTPQMAHDVSNFLAWVAQPHLEERHRLGIRVLVYLTLLLVLVAVLKRRVWASVRI
ncbi:cytochrome c1 [Lichenicoccus roseus]|uniref:Cytochrome c1 n=1 Tax=Lichenicoccus roseus TaxID=2683649 RepID=A0A5R9J890_9PROT|nr:cytochrome c1 [Lichenicoccus roseus]TLU73834.1 cytochrome c1 [Lichenicoccus roseus]